MHVVTRLREGVKRRGVWDVEVAREGTYEFTLRRWPEKSGLALGEAAPGWTPRDAATPAQAGFAAGVALPIAGARLRIGDHRESRKVAGSEHAALFCLRLGAGRTELEAAFVDAGGESLCPAFFMTREAGGVTEGSFICAGTLRSSRGRRLRAWSIRTGSIG